VQKGIRGEDVPVDEVDDPEAGEHIDPLSIYPEIQAVH